MIRSIQVSITTKCHAMCKMCTVTTSKFHKQDMDLGLFEKLLRDVESLGTFNKGVYHLDKHGEFSYSLGICGMGEPLEHQRFGEIADMLGQSNISWSLGTNGHHLNSTNSDLIIKNKPSVVSISVDAMTKETLRRIRPGLRLDLIHENVELFIRKYRQQPYGARIYIQIINFPINCHEIQDWINYHLSLIGDCQDFILYIKQACKMPESMDEPHLFPSPIIHINSYNDPRIIVDDFNNKWFINPKTCNLPWIHITISSNGDVSLCCMDQSSNLFAGNIQNENLIQIFNSEMAKEIRQRIRGHDLNGMLCAGCKKIHGQVLM